LNKSSVNECNGSSVNECNGSSVNECNTSSVNESNGNSNYESNTSNVNESNTSSVNESNASSINESNWSSKYKSNTGYVNESNVSSINEFSTSSQYESKMSSKQQSSLNSQCKNNVRNSSQTGHLSEKVPQQKSFPSGGTEPCADETRTGEELSTWWQRVKEHRDGLGSQLCRGLRWATLGYHHDWDTKVYSEAHRSPLPPELASLCAFFTRQLTLHFVDIARTFMAEAAIVNYYPAGATLSPHTDHSEHNKGAPLLSISFGQPCVFLIGGPSKATAPSAILLRSGDLLVMGGGARLCYHAVPLVGGVLDEFGGGLDNIILNNIKDLSVLDEFGGVLDEFGDPKVIPNEFGDSKNGRYSTRDHDVTELDGCEVSWLHRYAAEYRVNLNVRQVN